MQVKVPRERYLRRGPGVALGIRAKSDIFAALGSPQISK